MMMVILEFVHSGKRGHCLPDLFSSIIPMKGERVDGWMMMRVCVHYQLLGFVLLKIV